MHGVGAWPWCMALVHGALLPLAPLVLGARVDSCVHNVLALLARWYDRLHPTEMAQAAGGGDLDFKTVAVHADKVISARWFVAAHTFVTSTQHRARSLPLCGLLSC